MKRQFITRKGTFDSGHRVMNERMKCFNIHGHTYLYELQFEFNEMESIGYAIDFKEIKRVGSQWIDDYLDHGMILNPKDINLVIACEHLKSKYWLMSLNGEGEYCNPSVENIAKEIFMVMEVLFKGYQNLKPSKVTIYETPNCYTECMYESISNFEWKQWHEVREEEILAYAKSMGKIEYDDRKILN